MRVTISKQEMTEMIEASLGKLLGGKWKCADRYAHYTDVDFLSVKPDEELPEVEESAPEPVIEAAADEVLF